MKREDLVLNLGRLGYSLVTPDVPEVGEEQVVELLAELVDSKDLRLVEGFPVVLANCAQRGMNLDFTALLAKHKPRSRKRQNLEKLLLLSSDLLTQEGLDKPEGLEEVKKSFKDKYGDLLANEVVTLGAKTSLSTERLRNTLRRYSSTLKTSRATRKREKDKQRRSFQLNYFLSTLFSPKQKELVLKKLNGEPLSKTEKEYFSRTVKKKLEALNNSEVRKVAKALAA
ncbi:MAG: hypothetical protein P8075_09505 [Deltaproteobacteria bacterium]